MNILATSNIDSDGETLKLSRLEEMRNAINGSRTIRMGVEHNPFFPPIGQFYNARIEKREDGIIQLVADNFTFADEIIEIEGETFIKSSHERSKPFIEVNFQTPDENNLFFDHLFFKNRDEREIFEGELKKIDSEVVIGNSIRKSALNDPLIVLEFGALLFVYDFLKLLGNKLSDKIADDISEIAFKRYLILKKLLISSVDKFGKQDEFVTIVLQAPSDSVEIELVHRLKEEQLDSYIKSLDPLNLKKVCEEAIRYRNLFDGEKVQFVINDKGEWGLNYLLTSSGEIIGKRKYFDLRNAIYNKMVENKFMGLSYGVKAKLTKKDLKKPDDNNNVQNHID